MKGEDGDTAQRVAELEGFHSVLMDVSMGVASDRVRNFIIQAYVRGMHICGTADNAQLEGSTSVFTKRRYRDRWNRSAFANVGPAAAFTSPWQCSLRPLHKDHCPTGGPGSQSHLEDQSEGASPWNPALLDPEQTPVVALVCFIACRGLPRNVSA